jgi:hypothetical protein
LASFPFNALCPSLFASFDVVEEVYGRVLADEEDAEDFSFPSDGGGDEEDVCEEGVMCARMSVTSSEKSVDSKCEA